MFTFIGWGSFLFALALPSGGPSGFGIPPWQRRRRSEALHHDPPTLNIKTSSRSSFMMLSWNRFAWPCSAASIWLYTERLQIYMFACWHRCWRPAVLTSALKPNSNSKRTHRWEHEKHLGRKTIKWPTESGHTATKLRKATSTRLRKTVCLKHKIFAKYHKKQQLRKILQKRRK